MKVGSGQWAVYSGAIKTAHCPLPTAHYFLRREKFNVESKCARSTFNQYNSHSCHGRRAEGRLRPSRNADGDGACGLYALDENSALQSEESVLEQPRSFCALCRPRLDAALQHALPDRLRRFPARPVEA